MHSTLLQPLLPRLQPLVPRLQPTVTRLQPLVPRLQPYASQVGSRCSPDMQRLLGTLMAKKLTPAIVFAFSRKECEGAAMTARDLEPLEPEQVEAVSTIFNAAICTLSAADQGLDSVVRMLPLLQRGVAVHHSGLLPVLKEVVELLFQENLVRVLFATETFAMGVNMPARTVVFT